MSEISGALIARESQRYFEEVSTVLQELRQKETFIIPTVQSIIDCLKNEGTVFWCGNGGSAADSQHLAAELVGKFKINRSPLRSIALTTDTSILTAVANDYGYENVFSRQLEALGRRGDLLIGISTSGSSPNVVNAFRKAKNMSIKTVALTGSSKCALDELSDIHIKVPSEVTSHIQEFHIMLGQLICGQVEREMFADVS